MQGDDNNSAPAGDEEVHLGGGRNSEIPTDPSAVSLKMMQDAARVFDQSTEDGDEDEDRRTTDPSHPSHPSGASASSPASASSQARPATAVDRGPRKSAASVEKSISSEQPANKEKSDNPDDHLGKIFGEKYRIEKLIAKGGMGRVYRATQFPLERHVAVKILNREFQQTDPQFVRRFFLEASTAAKLAHPHTITVFDYGEAESGELYIAMELLKGRPLSKVIAAEGPFPPQRALKISIQICRAVREAHAMGIIHRDLKPGNVFLLEEGDEADYAKVLDFGLVKLFRPEKEAGQHEAGILGEGDPELTRTGTLLGSPKYMSPEQIQGHALDPRTDIYSFGVILFQMIAGKAPYVGATGVDVIYKHVHHPTPTIAEIAPNVEAPAVVEAIIQKCLRKRREERYSTMEEVIGALKEAIRMVAGGILSQDSMAESGSPLVEDARRIAQQRATSLLTAQPVPPPVREAAFRDPAGDEPTPTAQQERSQAVRRRSQARSSRGPLYLSAIGFLAALVTLLYVATAERKTEVSPAPAQVTIPARNAGAERGADILARSDSRSASVEMSFTSDPAGAQVFEAARPIGVTPFKRVFSINREAEEPREFVFRLEGYDDEVRTMLLDGNATEISAKLAPTAAEDENDRPSAKKKRKLPVHKDSKDAVKDNTDPNSPYRQNPY